MKKCKPGEFRGNPDGESHEVMPTPQTTEAAPIPPKKPPTPSE